MAHSCVWSLCLLMVMSGALALGSPGARLHHFFRRKTMDTLNEMAPTFPISCRDHGGNLLPLDLTRLWGGMEPGDRKLIAHRALRRIRAIYSGTLHNATWDRERTVFFRTLLDAQLEDLKESLGKRPSHSGKSWKNSVRKYFRKLRSFLRKEGYSTCSWAVVLDGTRRILQQLYTEGMN